MKRIKIEVIYEYVLDIDESNHIVKEYEGRDELISDLVAYRFDILPVLEEGVKVVDVEHVDWNYIEK